ncbi:DNA gyrase subunit A [Candidatus Babeliales bacterium]|nr:DNA gyrase subunit A [Candidatus Babeliales bacterium]
MAENDKQQSGKGGTIAPLSIEKELKTSFLDYAMSVIVSRALPDVRDGLKPVHRRILYAMHTLGLYNERPYRKSATVVGEVIGNYHPHGDSAIYQTMVGMAQEFARRYPLLDGQGNWGSIDGDNAAAMRYTEVKMAKIARDMLNDIEKKTVAFVPTFDESKTEPRVLPSRIPQLLVNGTSGIAVGMATSIPPHNLTEVIDACMAMVNNPEIDEEEIFSIIPAPDFPGGGVICGRSGILKAYKTGHGSVKMRGIVDIEENKNKCVLVIKAIPYQVNKADLITKIADLVKNKVIDGITNIRDESARDKMRVVIDIKRGDVPQVILNQLYKHTTLKKSLSMIMLALLHGRPVLLTLREIIEQFLIHRRNVIRRRTQFDLNKNRAREHILSGLIIALDNIDPIVELIKKSESGDVANKALQEKYLLSELQAKAILDMKLQRITGLEQGKIRDELGEIELLIKSLLRILEKTSVLDELLIEELEQVKKSYGDARRSSIEADDGDLADIDLISNDDVLVTLTRKGYVKRVKLDTYSVQHRGGKGKRGTADLSEADDLIEDVFAAQNHDDLLFFTNYGRVYTMKVFQVPEASRTARGRAIVNLLPLVDGERVVKLLCTKDFEDKFLVMVTEKGTIKKTTATAFSKVRSTGIRALSLNDGDELAFCALSSGNATILLATSSGQGIRFNEKEVRAMGRQAAGVRGISIRGEGRVVGLEVTEHDCELLFATSNGYGKRVRVSDFRTAHRGGLGVRTIPVSKRNGEVIGMVRVSETATLFLIDTNGKIIRLDPQEIRTMRRHAQGVRLIRLDKAQKLASVVSFESTDDDEDEEPGEKLEDIPEPENGLKDSAVVEAASEEVAVEETAEKVEPSSMSEVAKEIEEKPAKEKAKVKADGVEPHQAGLFFDIDNDDDTTIEM